MLFGGCRPVPVQRLAPTVPAQAPSAAPAADTAVALPAAGTAAQALPVAVAVTPTALADEVTRLGNKAAFIQLRIQPPAPDFPHASPQPTLAAKGKEVPIVVHLTPEMETADDPVADIAKVVSRKTSAIQRCLEAALRVNPDERMMFKVLFTVGTAGTVVQAIVVGPSDALRQCVLNKFAAIRGLPSLPQPANFVQPYRFAPPAPPVQPGTGAR